MSEPRGLKKSERTRLAILNAARQCFAEKGYDQVGLRELAAHANVTAALVNRYFGCKQNLLREALQDKKDYSELYRGPVHVMGLRLARFFIRGEVTKADGEVLSVDLQRLHIFIRSLTSEEARPIIRQNLAEKITGPLIQYLPGDRIDEKASLIISHVFGFLIIHYLVGAACAVKADRNALENLLGSSLQAIIDH